MKELEKRQVRSKATFSMHPKHNAWYPACGFKSEAPKNMWRVLLIFDLEFL